MENNVIKEAMVAIGRRLYELRLIAAYDGNISCRAADENGAAAFWATPAGVCKGFLTEDMLTLTDENGRVLAGERAPSSELGLHLRVYRENPAVKAVVHAHPP
ncbi:MAG: class II aldolase/adducin family protein, partial [Gracilibacteraceae bacterium]|nr:class II aldolase/adducin family protein [Gracilibacteraceae bacterium]